jgi:Fe-S-cluster containining protein
MDIETDVDKTRVLAERKQDENWRFRIFIKGSDLSQAGLDRTVAHYYADVAAKIDCCACASCCKIMYPRLAKKDIRRLAEALLLPENKLISEYLQPGKDKGTYIPKQAPCPFLHDKLCTVYEARPDNCKSFPNLHKRDFRSRLIQVVDNSTVCPIVYNVLELLKLEFWRGRRR